MDTDVHTNLTDVALSRLEPLIAQCVHGAGTDQNYLKLLTTSHQPLSRTMTNADPGLMIQTTMVCTKKYIYSNTKCIKLGDCPIIGL